MPRRDLSKDRTVKAIKPPAAGLVDFFDSSLPSFALRVTARGVKSWCCFYRAPREKDGKIVVKRLTLEPRYPALSCANARKRGTHPASSRSVSMCLEILAFGRLTGPRHTPQ